MVASNNPPSDKSVFVDTLQSRHGALLERSTELLEAAKRVPETVEDAEIAGKLADFFKQLSMHSKAVDKSRTEEKAVYLERGRWVDSFFKEIVIQGIPDTINTMKARLTAYQRREAERERRRREEEERARREEAERARQEAEAKAAAAENDDDLDAAVEAEEEAAERQAQAERAERATQAGTADLSRQHSSAGTVASLRTTWKCPAWSRSALDLEALRPYLADADLTKAIRAFIRAGGRDLRGATIEEVFESRVA